MHFGFLVCVIVRFYYKRNTANSLPLYIINRCTREMHEYWIPIDYYYRATQLAQLSLNITVAFKVWSSTATYFLTLLTYFLTYSLTLYLVTYLLTSLTYFTYLFTYLINFLILLTYLLASRMMYVTRRRPSTWRWPRQRRPSTCCWATQWTVPRWRRIDMHTWVMMICKKITHIHRICTTLTCKPFCSVHRWKWNKRFKRTQCFFFFYW